MSVAIQGRCSSHLWFWFFASLAQHLLLKPVVLHVVILRFIVGTGERGSLFPFPVLCLAAETLKECCIRKPVNAGLSVVLFVFFWEACGLLIVSLISHPHFYYS